MATNALIALCLCSLRLLRSAPSAGQRRLCQARGALLRSRVCSTISALVHHPPRQPPHLAARAPQASPWHLWSPLPPLRDRRQWTPFQVLKPQALMTPHLTKRTCVVAAAAAAALRAIGWARGLELHLQVPVRLSPWIVAWHSQAVCLAKVQDPFCAVPTWTLPGVPRPGRGPALAQRLLWKGPPYVYSACQARFLLWQQWGLVEHRMQRVPPRLPVHRHCWSR